MLRLASALACLLLVVLSLATPAVAAGTGIAADGAPTDPVSPAALQQSEGSLSLTVTDGDDTVAGAEVTLFRDGERVVSGETAADGTLDTGPVSEGSYRLEIRESGYDEQSVSVIVDGETVRSVTLEPNSVELTVDVTDARTGDPLADATVDVDAAGVVRTGADGTQTVRVPVNSEVGLVVTKDGYERESLSVVVDESPQSVGLEIVRTTQVSLLLSSDSVSTGDTVEATVTDAYGDPVVGASVLLDGEVVAETAADGTASVRVESAGGHTVRARAGGAMSEPRTVAAEGADGHTATPTPTSTATPSSENATAAETGTGSANGTATPADATPAPDGGTPGAPTDTENERAPFADLPVLGGDPPNLGDQEGPLGVLPPIQGSARIVFVLAGVGAVGLVFSILREDEL